MLKNVLIDFQSRWIWIRIGIHLNILDPEREKWLRILNTDFGVCHKFKIEFLHKQHKVADLL